MTTTIPGGLNLTSRLVSGLRLSAISPALLPALAVQVYLRDRQLITLFAAHVTALNESRDPAFLAAFNEASAAYVDGISLTLASWLQGGSPPLQKWATTDLAPQVMTEFVAHSGRSARVAVIGGTSDVVNLAADALRSPDAEVVLAVHGYQTEWAPILRRLGELDVDILILGLGMPLEALWVQRHQAALPSCLLITCGGWLRLLAGQERRAPRVLQVLQMEWLYRMCRDPRRTLGRYGSGLRTLSHLILQRLRGAPA